MTGNRVLLMVLSERTSAKGNAYLGGWLGKASVVAFRGDPDPKGNPTWEVFVTTPEPRDGDQRQAGAGGQASRPPRRQLETAAAAQAPHRMTTEPGGRPFDDPLPPF